LVLRQWAKASICFGLCSIAQRFDGVIIVLPTSTHAGTSRKFARGGIAGHGWWRNRLAAGTVGGFLGEARVSVAASKSRQRTRDLGKSENRSGRSKPSPYVSRVNVFCMRLNIGDDAGLGSGRGTFFFFFFPSRSMSRGWLLRLPLSPEKMTSGAFPVHCLLHFYSSNRASKGKEG
jgi:hypothetical protein